MNTRYELNYEWLYSPDFEKTYTEADYDHSHWQKVRIPHTNVELPYNNFDEKDYQIESCYRKVISLPAVQEDKRWILHFDGVMTLAKVYVNGHLAGEHKGGYTPFAMDITQYLRSGKNILAVYVDSREHKEIPPFGFVVDYLTYGGIYREVWLEAVDEVYLEHCHIKTLDVLEETKRVELDLFVKNYIKADEVTLTVNMKNHGQQIRTWSEQLSLNGEESERLSRGLQLTDKVDLWSIDDPNLYKFEVMITTAQTVDIRKIRTGFRQVAYTAEGFFLNGQQIKLRGLNRHQSFPYVGYAMPKSAQYKDAEILKKDLGVNVVRSSHYPPSDHFLDRCDELGLLVFDEIPGWQHIGEEGIWWDTTLQHVEEMIKKDWNHPSVFIWGVRINESQDEDRLYQMTNDLARKMDDSRPTGGVRCIGGSKLLEDVYTYNDFVHDGGKVILDKRKKIARGNVPYLVTEYNGHMFPTKKFDPESRRAEHALRHLKVIDTMMGDDEISGAIGWCMNDYNTHQEFGSGDKVCYHGVLDMYRIPKYAASVYSAEGADKPVMSIANSMENGDMDRSIRGDVMVYTNCDQVKMYINGTYIQTFTPRGDLYKGVSHPPVIIDDFIGDQIRDNEQFTPKDAARIKYLLTKVDKEGENLPLKDMMLMGWLFLKYKMNMKDASDLYTKYFGGWGSASTQYRFEGYINGECVITKEKSQVFKPRMVLELDTDQLEESSTYDTVRAVVRLVDDCEDDRYYANDTLTVYTGGNVEVIGPRQLALVGGSVAFWLRSNGQSGEGSVTISSERFGRITEKLEVNVIHNQCL